MGVYSGNVNIDEHVDVEQSTIDSIMEGYLYDEIQHLSEDAKKSLLETNDGRAILKNYEEAGLINKTAIVKLTKESEFDRRKTIAAYNIAKEKNDPSWKKFVKGQTMKMEAKEEILRKYGSKATMLAKKTQREYIKNNSITNYRIK